ncbi:N-acetylserotonin O-methyltransferase-like protein isoform X2 [Arapaima gigas]
MLASWGAVLLAETVLDERKPHSSRAFLQSLNMLVQTEGEERSFVRYSALLREHGFAGVRLCCTGNFLDALLAFKT